MYHFDQFRGLAIPIKMELEKYSKEILSTLRILEAHLVSQSHVNDIRSHSSCLKLAVYCTEFIHNIDKECLYIINVSREFLEADEKWEVVAVRAVLLFLVVPEITLTK